MTQVTLSPGGTTFPVQPGATILESGLSAGIALPFGCANGSCGDCRATVASGNVTKIRFHDYTLSQADKNAGVCLMCSNTATADVTLQVAEAKTAADIPVQSLRAKLTRLQKLDEVSIVTFRFIRGQALRFLAGQHALLTTPGGTQSTLAIASCPCDACFVEFHLPNTVDDNAVGSPLLAELSQFKPRDRVVVEAPFGRFTVSDATTLDRIFIIHGEAFASAQGMIEHIFNQELDTHCALFLLPTLTVGHYRDNLCRAWNDAMDEFSYHPLTATANVIEEIDRCYPAAMSHSEFYIAGPAKQLEKIQQRLIGREVPEQRIHTNRIAS